MNNNIIQLYIVYDTQFDCVKRIYKHYYCAHKYIRKKTINQLKKLKKKYIKRISDNTCKDYYLDLLIKTQQIYEEYTKKEIQNTVNNNFFKNNLKILDLCLQLNENFELQ